MIRIVVYSESDIEDVGAADIRDVLRHECGIRGEVRVTSISQKQYDIGMKRHRG